MSITRLRRPTLHATAIGGLLLSAIAHGQPASPGSPPHPDLSALVQCQASVEQFAGLSGAVDDPLQAVALGWAPRPRTNPFMAEYRLNTPVQAYGQHSDWLAISGGTVMLVLEQVSPQALAAELALEVVVDENGKFMAGRELVSRDWIDPDNGQVLIESAVIGVSTVASHVGKTLLGCTYSLDLPEEQPDSEHAPSGD